MQNPKHRAIWRWRTAQRPSGARNARSAASPPFRATWRRWIQVASRTQL